MDLFIEAAQTTRFDGYVLEGNVTEPLEGWLQVAFDFNNDLLLVAVAGTLALDVDLPSMLWFLGIALAGTLIALGIVAIVGTWPRLMQPDAEGQILQGGKSFIAAMIMVTLFQLALMPAFYLWLQLTTYVRRNRITSYQVEEWLPWVLGAAVLYGLLVATFGFWVGGRNYRRLLTPR